MTIRSVQSNPFTGRQPQAERRSGAAKAPPLGGAVGQDAIQGLAVDTLGILVPKLFVARGNLNRKEEIALEGLEDIAFYFTAPVIAYHVFSKAFAKVAASQGFRFTKHAIALATPTPGRRGLALLGAKAGTWLASVGVAAGLEFMVPHIKNVITAKAYNTKNFTAVANLESSRETLREGEVDPVQKSKKRLLPVLGIVGGLLALSAALPKLVVRNAAIRNAALFVTKHFSFSGNKKVPFDLSKPILMLLALVGFAGYLDASRDKLEKRELVTRVGVFTIHYNLFGKELAGNFLAWIFQNQKVKSGGKLQRIKDLAPLLDRSIKPTSFLDFNKVIDKAQLETRLAKSGLSQSAKSAIAFRHKAIWPLKFVLSAAVVGVLANLVAYYQTRKTYESNHEQPTSNNIAASQKTNPFKGQAPEFQSRHWTPTYGPVAYPQGYYYY